MEFWRALEGLYPFSNGLNGLFTGLGLLRVSPKKIGSSVNDHKHHISFASNLDIGVVHEDQVSEDMRPETAYAALHWSDR